MLIEVVTSLLATYFDGVRLEEIIVIVRVAVHASLIHATWQATLGVLFLFSANAIISSTIKRIDEDYFGPA